MDKNIKTKMLANIEILDEEEAKDNDGDSVMK